MITQTITQAQDENTEKQKMQIRRFTMGADAANLYGEAFDVYMEFMRQRFLNDYTTVRYAQEWAKRIKERFAYAVSDGTSRAILDAVGYVGDSPQ